MKAWGRIGVFCILGVLVVGTPAGTAAIVRLSLDGVTEAPHEITVSPGDVLNIYVVSYSPGEEYVELLSTMTPAMIGSVVSYADGGDLASVTDLSYPLPWDANRIAYEFELEVKDSLGNILAGKHFAFDVTIATDAVPGDIEYLYLIRYKDPDDTIIFNIIPEPGSIIILGLGALGLWRRRKKRSRCG